MLPRGVMPRGARARERQLLEAQRAQIAFKIPGGGRAAGECLGGGTVVNYTTSFRTPDDIRVPPA